MTDVPGGVPGDKSLPLVKTTCTRCPHEGKSRYPDTYLCLTCWYIATAKSSRAKAEKLRAKAVQCDREAQIADDRTVAFRHKYPNAGRV